MIPDFNTFKSSKKSIEYAPFLVNTFANWLRIETRWNFEIIWLLMFYFIIAIPVRKHFSITFFFENNDW